MHASSRDGAPAFNGRVLADNVAAS